MLDGEDVLVGQLFRGRQALRDPDGEQPVPARADIDLIAHPPRRLARVADRVRERFSPRVRRMLPDATAFTLYILLAIGVSARYWIGLYRVSPVRPADHVWSTWLLSHAAHALRHLENPLAGLPVRIPGGPALLPGTAGLGSTLPLAPVTLLLGPQVAYALWLPLAFAGTAATTYWVLSRYLITSRTAAFVGALVCAFAPGVLWHANGQPSYVANFLVPIIIIRTIRIAHGRVLRNGLLLGLLVVWQFFINPEVLVLTALAGGVAALCYWRMRGVPDGDRRSVLRGLGVALLTAGVLLAYPLVYLFSRASAPVAGTRGEDVTTFALYWRDSFAGYYTAGRSIGSVEQNSWLGLSLLTLAVIVPALMWRQSRAARVVTVTGGVFAVLGLGATVFVNGRSTGVPGPWWLLGKVPGLAAVPPTRLVLVTVVCLGLLLALTSDRLPRPDPVSYGLTFRRVWIVALVVALLPASPRPLQAIGSGAGAPGFITNGEWRPYVAAGQTVVPVVSGPSVLDVAVLHTAGMQEFDVPADLLAGPDPSGEVSATSTSPTAQLLMSVAKTGVVPEITAKMRDDARADLRAWHAAILVLANGGRWEGRMWNLVTRLVGQVPNQIDGAWVWDVRALTARAAS
jgi:hypothetical protein